jgi:coiled-coil domain-containing protein 61
MKQVQMTTFDFANQKLFIEVEEKMTGNLWRGDFPSKYIEDITQKTGSAKKFIVFLKMLLSALKVQNDQIYIDLLTY